MTNFKSTWKILSSLNLALLVFVVGCSVQKVHHVGTHTITVSRHGFEKNLISDPRKGTFEYEGVSTAGEALKVNIIGDKVRVNGADYGFLRPGDSVFIGDDGVAVNTLDYGESEKYLRANGSRQATVTGN